MSAHDPNLRNTGLHPSPSDVEGCTREAALRVAEHHLTMAEFAELIADMANGTVDIRIYSEAVVLMRDHRQRLTATDT